MLRVLRIGIKFSKIKINKKPIDFLFCLLSTLLLLTTTTLKAEDYKFSKECQPQFNEVKSLSDALYKKYGSEENITKHATKQEELAIKTAAYILLNCELGIKFGKKEISTNE